MYSQCIIKILIFLLFKFEEIITTHAISLENDVTKVVDDWITKIFEIDSKKALDLFDTICSYELKEFEYNSSRALDNFGTKLFFQDVKFRQILITESNRVRSESDEWDQSHSRRPSIQIYWKFSENKIRMTFETFGVRITGTLCTKKNQRYANFRTYLEFENTTFVAINSGSSDKLDLMKISHNLSYSDFQQNHHEYEGAMEWVTLEPESSNENLSRDSHGKIDDRPYASFGDPYEPFSESKNIFDVSYPNDMNKPHLIRYTTNTISSQEEQQLAQQITPILPLMLRENLKRNRKFTRFLGKIFQAYYQPKNNILTKHPDFLKNPRQFHYLIPKIPYLCFTLKRIVIGGSFDLNSLKVQIASGIFSQTLLIKNVEGSMTLDYGFEDEPPLKMNFHVDCLFISKKQHTNCIYVQAKFYQVSRAKANTSLTTRQAEVMINGLESAIASSISPLVEVGKICDLETPLEEIKITNTSNWSTIKESYKGWIPFSDDPDDTKSRAKSSFSVFQR